MNYVTTATKRIAYLCLEAPIEGQASYVHVKEIIDGLERRGWQVDLYAPAYSNGANRPSLVLRIFEYLRLQALLGTRLGKYRATYVRAHPLAVPIALIARLRAYKMVHEINGTFEDIYVAHRNATPFRTLLGFIQKIQFKWAAGLIAVTPQLEDWVGEIISPDPPPIEVVPNGANVDLFTPEARSDIALPKHYVVFFGGLTYWHGVDTMISALQSATWPDGVSLIIVGEGPESHRFQRQASHDPRLILLGRLPYLLVPGVVAQALGGLVPISDPAGRSSSAGLAPLKLFEILACGIPAIVSDLPFQSDLVCDNRCGLVFPPGDGEALAQAVSDLTGNSTNAKVMGRRGRQIICSEHSWDKRAGDTAAFLEKLF